MKRDKVLLIIGIILLVVTIAIVLNILKKVLLLIIFVTIHEVAHIVVAKMFKVKIDKMMITPFGEIAVIRYIEYLSCFKRNLIFLAGPFVNILISMVALILKGKENYIYVINLIFALFNLIPAYPLDGGKVLNCILTKRYGVLKGGSISLKISKIIIVGIMVLGIVQVILYPVNISILSIGVYLQIINSKERYASVMYFYNNILKIKNIKLNKGSLNVRNLSITPDEYIYKLIRQINWDEVYIFSVIENGKKIKEITEYELLDYFIKNKNYDKIKKMISYIE